MSEMKITYFGAAALELQSPDGFRVLIDPHIKDNPHTSRQPTDFFGVDLILVTHAAFDHLGDTLEIMQNSQAQLIAGFEVCQLCIDQGVSSQRTWMTIQGDKRSHLGFTVRTVHAQHASFLRQGNEVITGVPFGFVVTSPEGICVYHPGDTALFSDMKLYRELYRPQIMLVGTDKIAEPYPCETTPREAALATQWISPDVVIPAHYPPGSDAPRKFEKLASILAPGVHIASKIDQPFLYRKFQVAWD